MTDVNVQTLLERCADIIAYNSILLRRLQDGQTLEDYTLDTALFVSDELFQDLLAAFDARQIPSESPSV